MRQQGQTAGIRRAQSERRTKKRQHQHLPSVMWLSAKFQIFAISQAWKITRTDQRRGQGRPVCLALTTSAPGKGQPQKKASNQRHRNDNLKIHGNQTWGIPVLSFLSQNGTRMTAHPQPPHCTAIVSPHHCAVSPKMIPPSAIWEGLRSCWGWHEHTTSPCIILYM